ncbi:TlpA family protein disulfide reductase [Alkalihalobacillus sp. MEB130]|uniref:TlpA disulfide reductase family protein n=1 Tax=Alkalihalobacillus sp. MEB130 TaxID=2976704 RepID=UPI0028DD6067|nr:TlpA disulfide reductase family protein [Alkalihalobacillus sp. MEB130]MDT8862724.1 TlpA family protein disulfide reductase [Alkalihalobacillus sp. MEB130]
MKTKQAFYRSILIILLCGVGFMYSQSESVYQQVEESVAATVQKGVQVGQEALPIELTTLNGEQVSLDEYLGQPVVLNFFATWCHPCQEEMPIILEMEKKLKEKGAAFLAINMTSQEKGKEEIKPFLQHYRANFDPLLDKDGDVMKKYQIIGIPTTIVIDEQGMIVQRINGGLTYEIMEDLVILR